MVNVTEALGYLSKYDLSTKDVVTLGHLREWLAKALAQHKSWLNDVTGIDQSFENELAAEIVILENGINQVATLLVEAT